MPGFPRKRVAIWMVVASATTTAGAVAVNFATGWVRNLWAWTVVAALTVLSAVVSLRLARISESRQETAAPSNGVSEVVKDNTFNGSAYVLGAGMQVVTVEGDPKNDGAS